MSIKNKEEDKKTQRLQVRTNGIKVKCNTTTIKKAFPKEKLFKKYNCFLRLALKKLLFCNF